MKVKMNKNSYEILILESSRMVADEKKLNSDKQKLYRMMKDVHVRFTKNMEQAVPNSMKNVILKKFEKIIIIGIQVAGKSQLLLLFQRFRTQYISYQLSSGEKIILTGMDMPFRALYRVRKICTLSIPLKQTNNAAPLIKFLTGLLGLRVHIFLFFGC